MDRRTWAHPPALDLRQQLTDREGTDGDGDISDLFERLVNALDGLPGVELPPACDGEYLFATQEALGIKIPPEFALFSLLSDGITLDHGQLQLLAFDPDDPLDFASFNDPGTWHWAYADLPRFIYWGITWEHSLLGWLREQLLDRHVAPVKSQVVMPRAAPPWSDYPGSLDTGRNALVWLQDHTEQPRETGQLTLHPRDQAVLDTFGPIPRGKIIMPGAPWLLGAAQPPSLDGAKVMDAPTALIAAGELATEHLRMGRHAERTGESTDIHGIEPWQDGLGRTRLRWITDES